MRLLTLIVTIGLWVNTTHGAVDPFAHAHALPADMTAYVHVSDVAALRGTTARELLQQGSRFGIVGDGVRTVWEGLAKRADMDSASLFDACFGQSFTMAVRDTDDAGRAWVVIGEGDAAQLKDILNRLEPQFMAPSLGFALMRLPETDLIVARDGGRLVIAPVAQKQLLRDTMKRLHVNAQGGLADDPVIRAFTIDTIGGTIGGWVRDDRPNPGSMAIVAQPDGNTVRARVRGDYAVAPFQRTATKRRWDAGLMSRFESDALIVMMEPTDVTGGPATQYVEETLGTPWPGMTNGEPHGESRMFIVADIEGRQAEEAVDLRLPTVTLVVPTTWDRAKATEALDARFRDISASVCEWVDADAKDLLIGLEGEGPRQFDLAAVVDPEFPLLDQVSINWDTVSSDDDAAEAYWVMSSHPQALKSTCETLGNEAPIRPWLGRWSSVGSANGIRLSHHLRSYAEGAALLAEDDDALAFRDVMTMCADLAEVIDRGRWALSRPTATGFEIRLELRLAPPRTVDSR
ncbi:MAG: hypothetical protein AAF432_14630 [Planctomycetota bacterium]